MNRKLSDLRNDYGSSQLLEKNLPGNPLLLFNNWLDNALDSDVYEPNAMILSTIGEDSYPDSRVVLLKGIQEGEFIFFTNYRSAKAMELDKNNRLSLLFFWNKIHRQVRITGQAFRVEEKVSDEYFRKRPLESKIGARVSDQSSVIPDRDFLEEKYSKEKQNFHNKEIPRPKSWGGYRVRPIRFEFWQGRSGRLHDRIVYDLKDKEWHIFRLAP